MISSIYRLTILPLHEEGRERVGRERNITLCDSIASRPSSNKRKARHATAPHQINCVVC